MVRYLIRLGYLGTKYRSLQKLPECPEQTIQGILEMALQSVNPLNEPITKFSSRTDKGVHALMNVLHVDLDHKTPGETFQPHIITHRLNTYLRENNHDIIAKNTCVVPDDFNARRYATWRSYIYRLALVKSNSKGYSCEKIYLEEFLPIAEINKCHVVSDTLDTKIIQDALHLFIGVHDFTTFTKGLKREPWRSPIRTLYEFEFRPSSNQNFISDPQYHNVRMWEFYIKAQSFLHHQVRKMVGVLLSLGEGRLTLDEVRSMIEKPNPRKWVHASLPPACGLFLTNICFDKKHFVITKALETSGDETEKGIVSQNHLISDEIDKGIVAQNHLNSDGTDDETEKGIASQNYLNSDEIDKGIVAQNHLNSDGTDDETDKGIVSQNHLNSDECKS